MNNINQNSKAKYAILVFILFFISNLINSNNLKPKIIVSRQESSLNFNNKFIKVFNLGNSRLITSFLWVKTLLDSDIDHYKGKDLNSWMFHRFNTISELDPLFYENYRYGGQYLSVIKDDEKGAETILSKGVSQFPMDYWLSFYLGFHYLLELNQPKAAADLLNKIKFHPIAQKSIPYLPSIVAKLRATSGKLTAAKRILEVAYANAPAGSLLKKKYFDSLYSVTAQIDLDCLNNKNNSCSKKDILGNDYIFSGSVWKSVNKLKKLKLYKKKGASK